MKKRDVIDLIKYHAENNDIAFRNMAYQIANEFDQNGDIELAEYVMSLLSTNDVLIPQEYKENLKYLEKVNINNKSLSLPNSIKEDILGIINAIRHNIGVNRFLFEGDPGTGKTESAKQVARILKRELFVVNFDFLIDSKLGQTSKNISELFEEINSFPSRNNAIVLLDEIDAIALNRLDSNDLREMGRATTAFLKGLDQLDENVVIIATTNLYASLDKALKRRFDATINFNRYSREDLIDISEIIMNEYVDKLGLKKNSRLFRKILGLYSKIPYPADLLNIVKSAVAFSNEKVDYDYLIRLFHKVYPDYIELELSGYKNLGFTIREMEILTGISKSQISRELKG